MWESNLAHNKHRRYKARRVEKDRKYQKNYKNVDYWTFTKKINENFKILNDS